MATIELPATQTATRAQGTGPGLLELITQANFRDRGPPPKSFTK